MAVHTAGGERVAARRAVLADVVAPQLYGRLLDEHDVPDRVLTAMRRYQRGGATFKVNWALDRPVPWRDPSVAGAGTVHLADSFDELTVSAAQLRSIHDAPPQPASDQASAARLTATTARCQRNIENGSRLPRWPFGVMTYTSGRPASARSIARR